MVGSFLKSLQVECSEEDKLKYSRLLPSIEYVCDFLRYLHKITRTRGIAFPRKYIKLLERVVRITKLNICSSIKDNELREVLNDCSAYIIPNMYKKFGDRRTVEYTARVNFVETQLTNFAVMHGNIPQLPFNPLIQGAFTFVNTKHYNVIAVATYMLDTLTKNKLACNGRVIFEACVHLEVLPDYENAESGVCSVNSIQRRYDFTTLGAQEFLSDHENRVEQAIKAQDYYANMLNVMLSSEKKLLMFSDKKNCQLNIAKNGENEVNILSAAMACLDPTDPHNSTFIIPHTLEYRQSATKKDEKKTDSTNQEEACMAYFETCQRGITDENTVYIMDNAPQRSKKRDITEALLSQGVQSANLEGQKVQQQKEKYTDELAQLSKPVLQKAVEEHGGRVISTPPHQRDLQPVQRLWKMYKELLRNWTNIPGMDAKSHILKIGKIIEDLATKYEKLGDCVAASLSKIKSEVLTLLNAEEFVTSMLKTYKKDNNISASDKYPLLIIPIPDTRKFYAWRDMEHPQIIELRKYMKKTYNIEKTLEDTPSAQQIQPDNQEVFERPEVQEFLNSPFPSFCPKECAKYCEEAQTRFNMKKPATIITAGKRPRKRPSKDVAVEKQAKVKPHTSASSSQKKSTMTEPESEEKLLVQNAYLA